MTTDAIARIRRFNRAVTSEVGALDESFLGRGRPLGTARVLNAIGHGHTDIAEIRDYLGLDSGLMSRLLRSLEAEGLVLTTPHPEDARRRIASLTASGKAEYAAYESLSDAQAAAILKRHPRSEALLAAMDLIATALGRERIVLQTVDSNTPEALYCLDQYYVELGHRFATGYDVSLAAAPDAKAMSAPLGAFILAMSDDLPIGCVGLKGNGTEIAEIKRLWVAPAARGFGLARRLMQAAEDAARALAITTLRLDTNSALPEALALYQSSGWVEIDRFNDDPYPDYFFEKALNS